MIKVENLNHIYNEGTALESYALKDVSFEIGDGEFIGIIGRTGSGKSTLIQHLNGLLKATSGSVYYDGQNIYEKGYNLSQLRRHVGLVFQYPEYQLFETDVISDVAYGPKNLGMSDTDAQLAAAEALKLVGIGEEDFNKSPFDISGGQKRRVAIAGVLAMKPEVLILDEPTAGLDPKGRDEILGQIKALHDESGFTVILVSHSMEDVAEYAKRLLVVNEGQIAFDASPKEVFRHYKELESMGLAAPQMVYLSEALRKAGYDIPEDMVTVDEMYNLLRSK